MYVQIGQHDVALIFAKEMIGANVIDKGYSCIYFIFTYLVFCLVYHQFWELLCCFDLIGDVRAEKSKNEQSEAIRSQKSKLWAKQESMPQHEVNSNQKPESDMPQHVLIMPRYDKAF